MLYLAVSFWEKRDANLGPEETSILPDYMSSRTVLVNKACEMQHPRLLAGSSLEFTADPVRFMMSLETPPDRLQLFCLVLNLALACLCAADGGQPRSLFN